MDQGNIEILPLGMVDKVAPRVSARAGGQPPTIVHVHATLILRHALPMSICKYFDLLE